MQLTSVPRLALRAPALAGHVAGSVAGSMPSSAANPLDGPFAQLGDEVLDRYIRPNYFKKMEFSEPAGDPGWFGPDSPVWYVHGNFPVMLFGLFCATTMEELDPSIAWMGYDHSRIAERVDGVPTGRVDPHGALVRLAHSVAFFIATAYGPTATAERAARAVRAMHHTIKGTRPDGLPYDADDPEWLRWNYATVVWGIATAHERYHHRPLRGDDLDEYYREFTRVGEALGGTDLPASKGEVIEYLEAALPRLAVTPIVARRAYPNSADDSPAALRPARWFLYWGTHDMLPQWGRELKFFHRPDPVTLRQRRAMMWSTLNGLHAAMGPLREYRQAQARVAGGVSFRRRRRAPRPVADPLMSRDEVEAAI